ncbi:MAG: hypothetical protein IKQ16_07525 [Lentisphaeria bacterium]|nr:hypothetical protein [Lentisphaeria bacterium]
MLQSIQKLAERISSLIAERPFFCGLLTGLAVAFVVLLFLLLLFLIFRPRKLRCIVIPLEGGDLRINAKAVQGAVRSVAEKFPVFDVRRVGMYGKRNAIRLEVAMDFNGGDNVSVSDSAAQFRDAVAHMMTGTFGMDRPARIELEILRSGAEIDVPAADPSFAAGASAESGSGQSC